MADLWDDIFWDEVWAASPEEMVPISTETISTETISTETISTETIGEHVVFRGLYGLELRGFKTESPLEVKLLVALAPHFPRAGKRFQGYACLVGPLGVVVPQFALRWGYRADFAVIGRDVRFLVEVDGKEYHAASLDQVNGDKERDRRMLTDKWPTMRFPGVVVHHQVKRCVQEIMQVLEGGRVLCEPDTSI